MFRPGWNEEALWTLYALQGGVTRHYENDPTRGQGTARAIRYFQKLGQTRAGEVRPRMAVVSGHTHIIFDDGRQMQERETEHGEPRLIIAFNKDNTLEQPPERDRVKSLRNYFPGTMLSFRFYLDEEYLQGVEPNRG